MTYSSQFNKTKNLDIRTSFYNIELEFQLLEPSRLTRRTRRAFLQGSDSLCGSFIYPYLHTRITTINADTNGKKNDTPNQPAPLTGLEGACTGKVIVAGCSSSAGSVVELSLDDSTSHSPEESPKLLLKSSTPFKTV
mmetsp:Transcript_2455/g.3807  ORF Transcript_2455/g.3807 Transcript_2455/m.3807 type:complete len:137 (-) Transcript_2455:1146-1556(-)